MRGSLTNESTLRMRWPKYWSFSFSKSSTDIYFPAVLLLHLSNPSRLHMDQFSLSPVIKQFECLSLIVFSNGNHRNFPHCIFNKILCKCVHMCAQLCLHTRVHGGVCASVHTAVCICGCMCLRACWCVCTGGRRPPAGPGRRSMRL